MNLRTTPDAIPHLLDKKNVDMLTHHKVFSETELKSRCEITLENYCKTVTIEANTMSEIARREILPAIEEYTAFLAKTAKNKKAVDESVPCTYETDVIKKLSGLASQIYVGLDELDKAVIKLSDAADVEEEGYMIRDELLPKMSEVRVACDEAEVITAEKFWPFPTYGDLIFGVR